MSERSQADIIAAQERLGAAVKAYYADLQPDVYVDGWVVVVHKRSPEMEQEDDTSVGVISQHDMSGALAVGILDIALEGRRNQFFGG